MKLEIHWPTEGIELLDTEHTPHEDDSILLHDVLTLSYMYDVIIDNGKVTFVDKEQISYSKRVLDKIIKCGKIKE